MIVCDDYLKCMFKAMKLQKVFSIAHKVEKDAKMTLRRSSFDGFAGNLQKFLFLALPLNFAISKT